MGRRDQRAVAIAERRERVAARYAQGQTQSEIARAMAVNQATISRDLEWVRKVWLESSVRDFDQAIANELAKVDHLEREYWQAWERSKLPKETRVKERTAVTTATADGTPADKRKKTVEGQTGNKAYLDGVQWCITKRCELLGLKPKELPSANQQGTLVAEVAAMDASILPPGSSPNPDALPSSPVGDIAKP